jgi:hypothetical protein
MAMVRIKLKKLKPNNPIVVWVGLFAGISATFAAIFGVYIYFHPLQNGHSSPTSKPTTTPQLKNLFTVRHTDDIKPDGVHFRSPSKVKPTPLPITGYGVFKGNRVRVLCYAEADIAPQTNGNRTWYLAENITTPIVEPDFDTR